MTGRELLTELAPIVAPTIEAVYKRRDLCIFSTRVVIEVARYFRIEAKPISVHAVAYNRPFAAHVENNFNDVDIAHWKPLDGSYSVGIGFGMGKIPDGGRWPGHIGVVAEDTFGDFGISQAERPQHGILPGPAVVCDFDPDAKMWRWEHANGTTVEYLREVEQPPLYRSPDWNRETRWRPFVGAMIRYLRDREPICL